ncbi:piezo-type mechanosensitive ion channel component-like isoform X3 [Daktulosphaira vitifoliae]|uniref:piezo-type mechanosensitive ion channel component-like isoform X3 n=1 Tax=Daktulosphaira vitifoliae TaxID=58002 RepID=UPI0021A9847F|nr:piezo-type mechanosensitive ion channel component-like isoform X3 [Daktulosphaira vitifoliae]
MKKFIISLLLFHIILPLSLLTCVCLKQNALTGIYLFLLLYLPIIKTPTPNNINGSPGFFLRLVTAISWLLAFVQLIFQVIVLVMQPYAQILEPACSNMERLFRHIGFIDISKLDIIQLCLFYLPEFIMICTSTIIQRVLVKINNRNYQISENFMEVSNSDIRESDQQNSLLCVAISIGKYLCLVAICFAAISVPSIISAFYYITFIGIMTWWSCCHPISRGFAYLFRFVCLIACLHIIVLFVYQMEWAQLLLPPDSPIARYYGLIAIRQTICTNHVVVIFTQLEWPMYALPVILVTTHYLLWFESLLILNNPDIELKSLGMTRQVTVRLSQKGPNKYFFRNKTNRWRAATRKVCMLASTYAAISSQPTESTPLIRGQSQLYTTGPNQIETPSCSIYENDKQDSSIKKDDHMDEKEFKSNIFYYLIDVLSTVTQFITRTSYIGLNIVMMAWSITYHSWLTFILLLWASISWMVPQQRKTMLRSSPFLVFYAEFLLLSQFLYCMNLTDSELPQKIQDWNLQQIGFTKILHYPIKPLLIKTLFTIMFWITLRQYMQERREARSHSAVANMIAPLQVTVGTATAMGGDSITKGSQLMQRLGEEAKIILTKFWIWIVALVLFGIGITGERMTIFRIIYMALALVFLLTFQLSWVIWRKMMYGFWFTVIIYSMLILVMTYTYQFDHFPYYWEKYLKIPPTLQLDIGLETFETGELFIRLLTPTFFVIITVVQLYYFHKDFLAIYDIKSRGTSIVKPSKTNDEFSYSDSENATDSNETAEEKENRIRRLARSSFISERHSFKIFKNLPKINFSTFFKIIKRYLYYIIELTWLYAELHMMKIILLCVMFLAAYEVCVVHFVLVMLVTISLVFNSRIQSIIVYIISVYVSVLLLAKMIYQIEYIREGTWNVTCADPNNDKAIKYYNTANWVGFIKAADGVSLLTLLKGYISIVFVITLHRIVVTRQKYKRHLKGRSLAKPLRMFPGITYKDVDKDIPHCLKYLLNFGFYRFGVEITLISVAILIGTRMDLYAVIYTLWLLFFVMLSRETLAKLWLVFMFFIVVTIPLQYAIVIGLPPNLCFDWPWDNSDFLSNFRDWMFLPDPDSPPNSYKLLCDFIVLLFVSRQSIVFKIERTHLDGEYPGGTNCSIIEEAEKPSFVNPVPDFVSHIRSWLDIIKRVVLIGFIWFTLAIVFLAGTNRVNLFSLGYLIGSFIFLWQGNDYYLRPVNVILKWWNKLILYNILVISLKAILQIPGCMYMSYMKKNTCWMIQLFGISCIQKFSTNEPVVLESENDDCEIPIEHVGLAWDILCFGFLIFQRRLFNSHYFFRIVDETKAMAILASRGAELIQELAQKRIQEQHETESKVLEKIKSKMDRIKATQKKIQGYGAKDPLSHEKAEETAFAPLARNLSGSSILQSFHTPLEDEPPTLSYLQPPTPTSTVLTVSLEGYLDPKRMSFSSSTNKRPLSFDESAFYSGVFSPPPIMQQLRRQSSLGVPSTWYPRKRSASATYSHHTSVRSGDYYMFDEEFDDELDSIVEKDNELSEDSMDDSSDSVTNGKSDYKKKKETDLSTLGESSKSMRDEIDSQGISDKETKQTLGQKIKDNIRIFMAIVNSSTITLNRYLNRISRDYRYVIRTLAVEKKTLKKNRGFGIGLRTGSSMIWQPMPFIGKSVTLSAEKLEELEEKQELNATNQPQLMRLLLALWFAIISHSDLVCYFMIFLHQIKSATILSLPLPLMVFLWGTLTVPRPTKRFWVTLIAYTEVIVVIKCMFQFDMIPWNQQVVADNIPFYLPRIIGIEKNPNYATYDLFLLLVLFFHRTMLKSLGLWKSSLSFKGTNVNQVSLFDTIDTCCSIGSDGYQGSIDHDPSTEQTTVVLAPEFLSSNIKEENLIQKSYDRSFDRSNSAEMENFMDSMPSFLKKHCHPLVYFFKQLSDSSSRVNADVYTYMFLCDFFNIFVVVFGFSAFGSQSDGGVSEYFRENKVPIPFLIMLALQFALITIDRLLYLRKYILGKILFQFVLIIGSHIWMFFMLPAVTERQFNAVIPPQVWYMVKCFHLLLSAYQIRSGYPTRILGNVLCKNYNYINMILFKLYMLCPFVFELRTIMDWVWTETSMTLPDWLKMEDIFAHIFQLKCSRRVENDYPNPRGVKVKPIKKYFIGGGTLIALIAAISFPLLWFALGSTVGEPNLPSSISISIRLGSNQPIYTMSIEGNVDNFDQTDWNSMINVYKKLRSAQTFLSNYDYDDVGVFYITTHSADTWSISPPELYSMIDELKAPNATYTVKTSWVIDRVNSYGEQPKTVSDSHEITINSTVCAQLANLLVSNNTNTPVMLLGLIPKFIKVTGFGGASAVPQLMISNETVPYMNISVLLHQKSQKWWDVIEECPPQNSAHYLYDLPKSSCKLNGNKNNFTIYTFNDRAFPETLNMISGKGILGLYTTFVIVVYTFVRNFFTGISAKIMFDDMPYVDRILQLCLDIYLVRESGELDLEEDLFAKLVFLYRSPETLIKWTRPPDEMANEDPDDALPELSM